MIVTNVCALITQSFVFEIYICLKPMSLAKTGEMPYLLAYVFYYKNETFNCSEMYENENHKKKIVAEALSELV